jgi:hypothetical protein
VKRVIRALEYYHENGGRISEHNKKQHERTSAYNSAYFVLTDDRQAIYDRIDKRVDIMMDNVLLCRERMFEIWNKEYTANCKKDANDETRAAVRFILSKNIVLGNALSMTCVDENGEDIEGQGIIFPEWSFVSGAMLKRRDFRFDVLLKENEDATMYDTQFSLFGDDAMGTENWMIDPITNEIIPKPVREYAPIHYRRVTENV